MILISPDVSSRFFDLDKCRFRFENLNKYKNETILVNLASEHWGDSSLIYQLYNDLDEREFDFWILSHHPGDHKKLDRLVYYPWWYVYSKASFSKDIDIERSREFSLGCLHGSPRPHRIVNYFALEDRFPKEKMSIKIFDTNDMPWRHDDPVMSEDEQRRWELSRNIHMDRSTLKDDTDLTLPSLSNAYLYLVPETTIIDRIFITEKTWKTIAAGQLFLILGNVGTIAHLRELGVDVFDDIITHDYDFIENWRDRLDRIHTVIENLLQQDLDRIWNTTYQRRKENQRKLFSGEFMFHTLMPFTDLLEKSYVPQRRVSSLDAE